MMAANSHDASLHSPSTSLKSPNEYCPGLEVGVQNPDGHGPILIPDTPDAIVDYGKWPEAMEIAPGSRSTGENGLIPKVEEEKEKRPVTICGIRKNLYLWIALAIALVLIGAIVGGAVGGTRATRKKSSPSQSSSPQSNNTVTNSSSPARTSFSSRTGEIAPASPSATSLMTFKLQTWEETDFKGRSQFFFQPGGYHSPWKVLSYTWQPNIPGEIEDQNKLRCGVVFCRDTEFFGWWGRSSRRIGDTRNLANGTVVEPFNVFSIVCDRDWFDLEGGCPEKEALSTFITAPVIEAPTTTIPRVGAPTSSSQTGSTSTVSTTLASVTSRSN